MVRRQVRQPAEERLDRTLRIRRHVYGMDVYRHAGAGQPKHHVIAIQQFRD